MAHRQTKMTPNIAVIFCGGAYRIRTDHLFHAMEAL